jgi:alpha/beta superfamily hydrolase
MDFRAVQYLAGLRHVFTGSRDDIAPPGMLRRIVPKWNPLAGLEVVAGADHFFGHHLDALATALGQFLSHPTAAKQD